MRLAPTKLEALRTRLCGALILPGHAQYDVSREIWNRCFDRCLSVIVRCTTPADVIAAVPISAELVLGSAMRLGASWNRFSSSWDTFRFRPPNAISAVSKGFDQP